MTTPTAIAMAERHHPSISVVWVSSTCVPSMMPTNVTVPIQPLVVFSVVFFMRVPVFFPCALSILFLDYRPGQQRKSQSPGCCADHPFDDGLPTLFRVE